MEIQERLVELSKIESSTRPYLKKILEGLEECEELPYACGKQMYNLTQVNSIYTFDFSDSRDSVYLELLIRLLYPRGMGKNAVFIKKIEVIFLLDIM